MMQWKQRGCRAGPRDTLRLKTIYLPWGWLVASKKGADNDAVAPCSPHPLFPQPRSLWRGYLSDAIFILIFFYTLLLLLVIDSWRDCSLTLRKHRGQQLRHAQRKTLLNPSPPSTMHGDFMASYSLGHLYLIVACFHKFRSKISTPPSVGQCFWYFNSRVFDRLLKMHTADAVLGSTNK
ncbi:hypothetical protein B0J14DRAFT_321866 [Halenospora varia]|nr:hypothetical protein B0J14DRAFT_321866 [Halenospora varia]